MKHADLIKQMTLEEKASFCSGLDYWHTPGIEKLGIPVVMWTDGPHGIRKRAEKMDNRPDQLPDTEITLLTHNGDSNR